MVVTTVEAKKNDWPKDHEGGGVTAALPSPLTEDGEGIDTPRLLADTTDRINSLRLASEKSKMVFLNVETIK